LKKEAKTFVSWHACRANAHALKTKVFWFFFSKKNRLLAGQYADPMVKLELNVQLQAMPAAGRLPCHRRGLFQPKAERSSIPGPVALAQLSNFLGGPRLAGFPHTKSRSASKTSHVTIN
jgi:hypothetical protein